MLAANKHRGKFAKNKALENRWILMQNKLFRKEFKKGL